MEAALRKELVSFDTSVVNALATNDVRTLDDAKLLSNDDLKELGFSLRVRNRLMKTIAEAKDESRGEGASRRDPGVIVLKDTLKVTLEKTGTYIQNLMSTGMLALKMSTDMPPDLTNLKATFDFVEEVTAGAFTGDTSSLRREVACCVGSRPRTTRFNDLYPCWDTNENGFLSLAEMDQGIKVALIEALKSPKKGERIWRRFRKSSIRAFVDAADVALQQREKTNTSRMMTGGKRRAVRDEDYVSRGEFRLLIDYIVLYATMYELFSLLDGCSEGITIEDNNCISRYEWDQNLPKVTLASMSWAPFVAVQSATKTTFDDINTNEGGLITLTEFCDWIEKAEKAADTETGKLLSASKPPAARPDGQRQAPPEPEQDGCVVM